MEEDIKDIVLTVRDCTFGDVRDIRLKPYDTIHLRKRGSPKISPTALKVGDKITLADLPQKIIEIKYIYY